MASLGETWHRWDVVMGIRASMWASGRRHGRRGSLVWAGTTTCSPHLIMGRRGTSIWASVCHCGRRHVGMGVSTSSGASGHLQGSRRPFRCQQGRRDVGRAVGMSAGAVGTSAGPSGRRQAVGTSAGPSGRRQGRRDAGRAVRCHQDWTNKVRYRNLYRRVL